MNCIYKVVDKQNSECLYIGYTKSLYARKAVHHTHSKNIKKTSKFYKYVRDIGFDRLHFETIIELPVYDRTLLSKLERHYYDLYKPTKNYNVPSRTQLEYMKDNYAKIVHHNLVNREKNNIKNRQKNSLNHEVINARAKLYYHKNRVKILNKLSTQINCPCGATFRFQFKKLHRTSDLHRVGLRNEICKTIENLNLPKYE